jgi:hypothetical protein
VVSLQVNYFKTRHWQKVGQMFFSHLTSHSRHLTSHSRHMTSHSRQKASHSRHMTSHIRHVTSHIRHVTSHSRHMTSHSRCFQLFSYLSLTKDTLHMYVCLDRVNWWLNYFSGKLTCMYVLDSDLFLRVGCKSPLLHRCYIYTWWSHSDEQRQRRRPHVKEMSNFIYKERLLSYF